ncbi:hypothetical protein AKO1_007350, partial [Acrasis kona]
EKKVQDLTNSFIKACEEAEQHFQKNQHERHLSKDYYATACDVLLSIKDPLLLTEVKKSIDCSGESLVDFVFDVLSLESRTNLLSHIQTVNDEHNSDYSPVLLTDIDDTLFASLIDRSFKLHSAYPGVTHLYHYITTNKKSSFVGVLSARPKLLRKKTRKDLAAGALKGTEFSVIDGDVIDLPSAIKGTSLDILTAILGLSAVDRKSCYAKMANTKFLNYTKIALIYPELKFVFFGDSGQGDVDTAMMMATSSQVICSYIHDLRPTGFGGESLLNDNDRSLLKKRNIFVFDHHCDVLSNDQMKKFLTGDQISQLFEKVESELEEENDMRGYWEEFKSKFRSDGDESSYGRKAEGRSSSNKNKKKKKTSKCVIL